MKKTFILIALSVTFALSLLLFFVYLQSINESHFLPDYHKINLEVLLEESPLTKKSYETLFMQTGLAPKAVDEILATSPSPIKVISDCQTTFFQEVTSACVTHNNLTKEDFIVDSNQNPIKVSTVLTPQKGDILIHLSSHTLGWRNGHSGLVIDPIAETTLEAIAPHINSGLQTITKWNKYTNFILLRLKEPYTNKAPLAADMALEYLNDLPYSITIGMFKKDEKASPEPTATHCSHLVWKAFHSQGIDLDSNGGRLVTPQNILESGQLEVIQIYGFNPEDYIPIFN